MCDVKKKTYHANSMLVEWIPWYGLWIVAENFALVSSIQWCALQRITCNSEWKIMHPLHHIFSVIKISSFYLFYNFEVNYKYNSTLIEKLHSSVEKNTFLWQKKLARLLLFVPKKYVICGKKVSFFCKKFYFVAKKKRIFAAKSYFYLQKPIFLWVYDKCRVL